MPYIERVLAVSWAAIRAVPVKTQPHRVRPTPRAIESASSRGYDARLAATKMPTTRLASSASLSAAVIGASRPIAAARTSSSRPVSSSARVCRPMMNMLIKPTQIAPKAVDCQVTWPPMVSSARAGPAIAMNAALLSMLAAARSNSACVAYRPSTLTAWL